MTLGNTGTGGLVGRTLGHYQLSALLGTGGMAEIYRAHDSRLNREVAVKVLPALLAADPSYVERFRSEAKHVASLRHPNIVPVFDYGEQDGLLYLVMPLLPGSLRDRIIPDSPMPITDAIAFTVQIAGALEAAHAQGIVHRDVKPENILLDANGDALLTDFGIARELSFLRRSNTVRTLSATGLPIGTPEYMAPEQLRDGPVDQRADVYALGAILYELLTTHAPHEGVTPYEVAAQVLTAPVTPPSQFNPKVGPELDAVVTATLSPDPALRPQSVAAFAQDVAQANRRGLGGLLRATVPVFRKSTVFDGDDRAANQPPTPAAVPVATRPRPRKRARLRIGLLVAALALLAGLGAALLYGKGMLHSTSPIAAAKTATATTYPTATLAPTATSKPKPTSTATPKPTSTPRPAPTATPVPPLGTTATFVRTDTRTQGNWKGVYGSIGYNVFEDASNLPKWITVTPANKSDYTWSSSPQPPSKYPQALQRVEDGSQRIAAAWYTKYVPSYSIDVNITDGKQHQLALYCLDWDSYSRAETITITDSITGKVLDTQSISDSKDTPTFHNGVYFVWKVSGHITITLTHTGGYNAVSSGIFFD